VIVKDCRVLLVQRRVKEGSLSWQFPAGEVEPDESAGEEAVRETREETGLVVAEAKNLGERIHPATGRTMIYVACDAIEGEACVVDDEELVDFAWVKRDRLAEYVPYGFFPAVQDYLDATLSA
jgi:8-oxo-dGTP diphosphatase